MVKNF